MDIRDTVSRVLLGIAFGFVMGIVMYQAAGIDAGVIDKTTLSAQGGGTTSAPTVCGGSGPGTCGGTCGTPGWMCIYNGVANACVCTDPMPPASSSSSVFSCPSGTSMCNGMFCCTPSETCTSVGCGTIASSSSPAPCPGQVQCFDLPTAAYVCCDACGSTSTGGGCSVPSSPSSPSSSGGSSSSGGCCNTTTNTCGS